MIVRSDGYLRGMDRRIVVAETAILSLLTLFAPSSVSASENPRSYLATYEYDMAGKSARMSETLTVHDGDPQPSVSLASTSGAVLTQPTTFQEDGEISGQTSDPSVLCYNMAAATLFSTLHSPDKPASIFVRVGDSSVGIPMHVKASAVSSDGSREFVAVGEQTIAIKDGDGENAIPAQLMVQGKIRMVGNAIQNVVFSEASAVGNASNVVNQQTCTLNPGVALPPVAPGTAESSS